MITSLKEQYPNELLISLTLSGMVTETTFDSQKPPTIPTTGTFLYVDGIVTFLALPVYSITL